MKDMKEMRRAAFILLGCLLAVIVGILFYYETHFTMYEARQEEIRAETALRKCPQLEITETDLAMAAAALELPEVKEALEQGETTEIWDERVAPVKEIYGADSDFFLVGALEHSVYIDINQSESVRTILSVWPDDSYPPRKTVALYGKRWNGDRKVTVYENENGESFSKLTEHRRWFAYFRDRMWEE